MGTAAFVFLATLAAQLARARRLSRELLTGTEWLLAQVRDPWSSGGKRPQGPPGTLRSLRIGEHCPSIGRRLSELDLPERTGVTVIALVRDGCRPVPLHPSPILREGDLLALAGPESALNEAESLIGESG